ncbi:hypothetical protein TI39_contig4157g00001 [Zymoseptoria brevis]|uniref:Uncharacterized protein n=1 Tax=Zymoseptoria brevis TaxID=1047168 RepID=A0A0F4GF58_9PEZI|nr:hypothetical protein TI39_contig4157g00001 [Zymoseptoria brevis]
MPALVPSTVSSTIRLTGRNTWDEWLDALIEYTGPLRIWQYIDLDKDDADLPSEPVDVKHSHSQWPRLEPEMTDSQKFKYTNSKEDLDRQQKSFLVFEERKAKTIERIQRTINTLGRQEIRNRKPKTLRDRVQVLKELYAPTDYARRTLLGEQLKKLEKGLGARHREN